MSNRIRTFTAGLLAAVVLSIAVGHAMASRSIQLEGGPSVAAQGHSVVFSETRLERELSVICDVTLLRTLARAIPKVAGTSIGRVTGVTIDRGDERGSHCSKPSWNEIGVIPLAELRRPGIHRELGSGVLAFTVTGGRAELWRVIYDSFQGVLPSISGINYHIENFQLGLRYSLGPEFRAECLYAGSVYGLLSVVSSVVRSGELVLSRTLLNRQEGTFLCPRAQLLAGPFLLSPTLTIRLL